MKNTPSYTDQIMKMIAENRIKDAIQEAQNLLKGSPEFYEITLQSARYSDVMQSIRKGTINFNDASVEKNKIRLALINMIQDLEESCNTNAAVQTEVQAYLDKRAAATANIKGNENINIQEVSGSKIRIQINKNTP